MVALSKVPRDGIARPHLRGTRNREFDGRFSGCFERAQGRQLSNIDLYKHFMERFAVRDFGSMREMMDEAVRSENLAPSNTPIAGDRIGIDALMGYFVLAAEPTADYEFLEAHTWLESGDVVVAIGREAYRIKSTGKRAETPFVHETHWKEGRLLFWREFYDTAAMRDAYSPET